jgi:antitoxin (DNA-binding transcriptional repressor) of toxin-antitoxin stability system
MTAAEAARHFRAVLSRVAAGEEIQVVRDGVVVAVIAPVHRPAVFRDPLEPPPRVGDSFIDDLRALQAELRAPPDSWAA